MRDKIDVVVVGGGLSGLATARAVRREGRSVVVLEARERTGGRILTRPSGAGGFVDLGAQWIGPGQDRILALAREFSLDVHPTYTKGKTAFAFAGAKGASRVGFPVSRLFAFLSAAGGMARLERLSQQLEKNPPWAGEASAALPELSGGDVSVQDFIEKHVRKGPARDLLGATVEGIFCQDPKEISLLLAAYAISRAGGLSHMQKVEGGAQEQVFSEGAGALVARLTEELGEAVRLGAVVTSLSEETEGVIVRTETSQWEALRVVIALPPPLVARLEFSPPLEEARRSVYRAAKMGSVVKCCLVYETPFWRGRKLSGTVWSTGGPVNVCYDVSGGSAGVLSVLAVARSGEELASLSAEERRRVVTEGLAEHLGEQARAPVSYSDLVWNHEQYTGGGYSMSLPPGAFSSGPEVLRAPVGRIHFAGSETAQAFPGYMEGALESAERVSREVLGGLG